MQSWRRDAGTNRFILDCSSPRISAGRRSHPLSIQFDIRISPYTELPLDALHNVGGYSQWAG